MNKLSELIDSVRNVWMPAHRRHERLCVLAATGQLGGAHMWELNEHIAKCDSCRKFLESIAQVSLKAMPVLADNHVQAGDVVPPEGMRARFLARMAAGRLDVEIDPVLRQDPVHRQKLFPISVGEPREEKRCKDPVDDQPASQSGWFPLPWRSAAALAFCTLVGIGAFYLGEWKAKQTPQHVRQTSPSTAPISESNRLASDTDRVNQLEQQKSKLEINLAVLRQSLSAAQTEQESLREELARAKAKLAALTMQAQTASQRSLSERQEDRYQIATLQSEANRLGQLLAESEVKLGVEKQAAEQLTAKLEATEANLERERDLKSAKSELGDLVAARNLHIVDVYDADATGKRQRSFGRVFYIEGKSLVFYAYDLDAPGRFKANVVFYVWGGKAGVKEVTHSLGILRKEDVGQGRWAMTFDDPKVLAQINSVFVTAESASKNYNEPHGKKILYAYFGSPPNHP